MQLSKAAYYADFVVYPPLITGLVAFQACEMKPWWPLPFLSLCLAGIVTWTLFEYLLHRFVLHKVPILEDMHEAHHADPTAYNGTPSWLSLTVGVLGILLPLWWAFGFEAASALTTGLMVGYLAYVSIHHICHHWRLTPGSWLYGLKHRHARHHFSKKPGNFGVTTNIWDFVFGTQL